MLEKAGRRLRSLMQMQYRRPEIVQTRTGILSETLREQLLVREALKPQEMLATRPLLANQKSNQYKSLPAGRPFPI